MIPNFSLHTCGWNDSAVFVVGNNSDGILTEAGFIGGGYVALAFAFAFAFAFATAPSSVFSAHTHKTHRTTKHTAATTATTATTT